MQVQIAICHHGPAAIETPPPHDMHVAHPQTVGGTDNRAQVKVVPQVLHRYLQGRYLQVIRLGFQQAVQVGADSVVVPKAIVIGNIAGVAVLHQLWVQDLGRGCGRYLARQHFPVEDGGGVGSCVRGCGLELRADTATLPGTVTADLVGVFGSEKVVLRHP